MPADTPRTGSRLDAVSASQTPSEGAKRHRVSTLGQRQRDDEATDQHAAVAVGTNRSGAKSWMLRVTNFSPPTRALAAMTASGN